MGGAQFTAIEDDLRKLLEQFGPSSAAASRHYPFWHLRTDGLWTLDGPARILDRPPAATPNLTELISHPALPSERGATRHSGRAFSSPTSIAAASAAMI